MVHRGQVSLAELPTGLKAVVSSFPPPDNKVTYHITWFEEGKEFKTDKLESEEDRVEAEIPAAKLRKGSTYRVKAHIVSVSGPGPEAESRKVTFGK